jgi:Tfp pilus assembly protein PilX
MEERLYLKDEDGSVLVVALIMLVLLTILGISASTTSTLEIQIAGNEKFHMMAFYAADGGTEAGAELLEQNIEDRGWPNNSSVVSANVMNGDFWANVQEPTVDDAQIPNFGGGQVNLRYRGDAKLSTSGAIQLISGYEGKGKGASGGGAYLVHEIRSQALGVAKAESVILVRWRHML